MMGYSGFGMGAFGWLGMLLFWGFIALGIVYLWRSLELSRKQGDNSNSNALDIAKERYAKGEISKEEFDQLKHDLA